MSEPRSEAAEKIYKSLNRLIVVTVVIFLALLGMGIYVYTVTKTNNKALCAVRQDAERRSKESAQFLADHPRGFAGITPGVIKRSVDSSNSTVSALKDVNCSTPPTIVGAP